MCHPFRRCTGVGCDCFLRRVVACDNAKLCHFGRAAVAQWIEYWPPKPRVVGSIPASRTMDLYSFASCHGLGVVAWPYEFLLTAKNWCYNSKFSGGVPEWLKGADCKSVGLRLHWFESSPLHQ